MISHDPVRIRLREALEHSAAGRFLRGARTRWADAWAHARMPSKADIRALEQQGNECDAWPTLRLLGTGSLAGIRDCRFEGHNVLRLGDKPAQGPVLRDSVIRDCLLGVCTVERVALLERMIVESGAVLRHLGACAGKADSCFCLGLALHPGSEAGARRVFLADSLLLEDYAAMAALAPAEQEALAHEWASRLKPCVTDYAFVGAGARIEHTRFVEDSYVGAGAVIRGATAVRRCVIAAAETPEGAAAPRAGGRNGAKAADGKTVAGAEKSAPCADDDIVRIGDDVIVEDCVLQAGTRLASAAQARRTLFLEHSGAEQGGHVADAVIGPNNHIAKGEVTASLVGPFVGFHHQALLIGALWPEGRGNVGYGANVGSNHTGRKPDQELRPGEGTFFGLSCAIKYPADFSAAPYSLFATGVTTPPQRIAFPFSLITPGGPHTSPPGTPPEHAGLNEIIPGWMWGENAYALIRNTYKYADRNTARHHPVPATTPPEGSPLAGTFLAGDVFAPRIADAVRRALAQLDAVPAEARAAVLTERDVPAAGKNALLARRVNAARDAYRHYLLFVFCRALLWAPASATAQADKDALAQAAREAGLSATDAKGIPGRFLELGAKVEASLRRDAERGLKVFDDYASFHPEAAHDTVGQRLRAELAALEPVLRERLKTAF